jgi:chemotaxis regulatin CheY-phosphate phosphatase CheZ
MGSLLSALAPAFTSAMVIFFSLRGSIQESLHADAQLKKEEERLNEQIKDAKDHLKHVAKLTQQSKHQQTLDAHEAAFKANVEYLNLVQQMKPDFRDFLLELKTIDGTEWLDGMINFVCWRRDALKELQKTPAGEKRKKLEQKILKDASAHMVEPKAKRARA